jgi:hypothetical protein
MPGGDAMHTVREPAVAGLFYPGDRQQLQAQVNNLLAAAPTRSDLPRPKALIVPHAGYVYSGAVAAAAYAPLQHYRDSFKKVVLLGPAHRVAINGLALMDVQFFRTPLGDVPQHYNQRLLQLPQVNVVDQAHWQEHSLEVQLPFLQTVLTDFSLVALVVGNSTASDVEQVLSLLWGGPETLVVISSDLSHYRDYQSAQYIDQSTCQAIEALNIEDIDYRQACGCVAVKGLLRAAKKRQMQVKTLAMSNSGDSGSDKSRVVGYGSWSFSERSTP